MDIFIEQIIVKKPDIPNILLKIALVAVTAVVCGIFLAAAIMFAGISFITVIALAAIPGVIWLGVHFFKSLIVEYEYILTNNELELDKITGKSRRKNMVTLNLQNAERFGIYSDNVSFNEFNADVTVSAHDNTRLNMWYLLVKDGTLGRVVVLFNPNDDFVIRLNKSLPLKVRNNTITERARVKEWS
ncbi:MAG: hypothetical protein FWH07_03560 [Oscillospiraceae bacterium]|nr:hypothetical protein [Oscillospiraceae bacterium]